MKVIIATILVIIAMIDAEPQRYRNFARQSEAPSAPYEPKGYRPQGAAFILPRFQSQQTYGAPPPAYGPPEATTTEIPTTTESETEEVPTEQPQVERIRDDRRSGKIQQGPNGRQNPVYLVVPQSENYLYAFQQSAPLVAVPQTSSRLQAIAYNPLSSLYSPYNTYIQYYQ